MSKQQRRSANLTRPMCPCCGFEGMGKNERREFTPNAKDLEKYRQYSEQKNWNLEDGFLEGLRICYRCQRCYTEYKIEPLRPTAIILWSEGYNP